MRAILTYHSVDDSGSVISVSPPRFAEHVRWLASGAVAVVSVADLLTLPSATAAVAITFDDGFTNFASTAWPLLRDRGLPVTLFVPTYHVGRTNQWATTPGGSMPPLPLLDWEALGRLAEEGVVLGGHSRTHADLRRLGDAEVVDEIAGSFDDIARETGRRPDGFAYPYGYLDERVVRLTRTSCRWACTTVLRPLSTGDDPYRLPRLDAYFLRGPARLDAYSSLTFRSYISLRATVRRLRGR
jgi:peptidoglycan/xylan/chitin deacetylase (PgdA/CDA1 family)